jgi:hypothetical protein
LGQLGLDTAWPTNTVDLKKPTPIKCFKPTGNGNPKWNTYAGLWHEAKKE